MDSPFAYLAAFAAWLFVITSIDTAYLSFLNRDYVVRKLAFLMEMNGGKAKIRPVPAVLSWASIVIGILVFVVPQSQTFGDAALLGAAFGLVSYAAFDFTNLSFIKGYSWEFSMVDMAWGTFLSAVTSVSAYGAFQSF